MRGSGKPAIAVLVVLIILTSHAPVNAQIDFSYHSDYSYIKGKDASALPASWKDPGFDYSGWPKGSAPFHYGDGTGGTELADMINSYSTLYLRSTFLCSNSALIKELTVRADYDDGFILWINGSIAVYRNVPGNLAYNGFAPANHESGTGEEFKVNTGSLNLVDGINYIAVQGFNVNLTSTDFYIDIAIYGEKYLPELVSNGKIDFSAASGFYDTPFSTTLTSTDLSAQVIYTLDGSNPQNSKNSFISDSPVTIPIDPDNTAGRPATPSVIIRASLTRPGFKPSKPASRTYIFLEKVKTQTWPGGEWPTYNVNGQLIDLDMDRDVVSNPNYAALMDESLLDLPSISIVTDLKNLFDPASGIYVNAAGHGLNWEKECSVELIQPDGSEGFSVNAGLRIRGGWSRNDDFPKHGFRLFFREEYGNAKLDFPLFGDEGVTQFDKLDLRTEQNYAWSNGFPNNSLVREVFSRDSQRDMGQPYTRSRYYHLYLNGMYWGVFQSQERSEARYAESYFGGNSDDYDVIKVNTENGYNVEVTDGKLDSWQTLWNLCQKGFTSDADYFRIEGKDKEGNPVKGGKIMVNIDNLIDFMMVIFYTGNFDSPTSSFMQNKGSNNFYAIDNREDNSEGFTFYVHDAEHSLFDEPHNPGIGLSEDRVNIGTRTDNMRMEVSDFIKFHPQWLHFKLSANPEYRIRFADRAWKHLSSNGVFAPAKSLERINKRINEVSKAVIAESARWGDARTNGSIPYTRNDNWLPEINKIRNNFIPNRTGIVIDQLKKADLYPVAAAPVITGPDGVIKNTDNALSNPVTVQIENPNSSGTIYYTLDGSDPRKTGGGVSVGARFSLNNISLQINGSTQIKARILEGGEWSAVSQVNFIREQEDYSGLKVTELHYHPPDLISGSDTTEGKDLEFIEFKNTGKNAVNLSGLVLDSAIQYSFPVNNLLAPGRFWVIASKPSKFYDFYGLVASGNYTGNFSNGGEEVLLKNSSANEVIDFSFSDASPWPSGADGDGYSLSSKEINPAGNPGDYSYWTLSVKKDGTPFADNYISDPGDPGSETDGNLTIYPNPTTGLITIHINSDEELNEVQLLLFDITGRQVRSAAIGNPGMFNLSETGLPDGVYILKINSPEYSSRVRVILAR